VLALIVLDGIAVIATYSRFWPTELYHVHHSDTVAGGFGKELVALNFPFWFCQPSRTTPAEASPAISSSA
jgi:hypothetical protein